MRFLVLATAAAVALAPHGVRTHVVEPPVLQLTRTGARNGQGSWSPAGREVAFVSNRSGSWQVWLMDAEGGHQRQLTQATGPVGWPSWTPDGRAILFYQQTAAGHRLFRITPSGNDVQPVFHDAFQDFRPSLSPDASRLLFDRFGSNAPPNHDLFVRNLRDSTLRQLTNDAGYDSDARWSPNGQQIVWHSDRGQAARYHNQVYVSDADGTNVRQLTRGPAVAAYPSWSPDGRRIVYTVEADRNRDIWVMNADGSDQRRLTEYAGFDGDPVWSPTGDRILITTARFGGEELALLDVSSPLRHAHNAPVYPLFGASSARMPEVGVMPVRWARGRHRTA